MGTAVSTWEHKQVCIENFENHHKKLIPDKDVRVT